MKLVETSIRLPVTVLVGAILIILAVSLASTGLVPVQIVACHREQVVPLCLRPIQKGRALLVGPVGSKPRAYAMDEAIY